MKPNLTFTKFIDVFSESFGKYKPEIITLSLIGFMNGILGGIGISAVIPLFSLVSSPGVVGQDMISNTMQTFFGFFGVAFTLGHIVVFVVLLFVCKAVFSLYASYLTGRIVLNYQEKTRMTLLRQTLSSGWPHLLTQKLGHLETILLKNVEKSTLLLEHTSLALMTMMTAIAYIIIAFKISMSVTLSLFVFSAGVSFALRSFPRRIEQFSARLESYFRNLSHYVNESILGIKMIKARGVEEPVVDAGRIYVEGITRESLKIRMVNALPGSLLEPASIILVVVIFLFERNSPAFSIVALGAVIYIIKQIFTYLVQLQTYIFSIRELTPYARAILLYQDAMTQHVLESGGREDFEFREKLDFRDVYFTHASGKVVLKGTSFCIKRGELIGLIGPSGAGKTTLVDLILRLFVPDRGGIFLDGRNISEINGKMWHSRVGYVPQEVFLLNGTIAENIRFYDDSISDDAIIEAAKLANIYDFVESLPKKWDTEVGERGVLLSGGQKQRIGIAMALARRPEIIILDEATSALDNESESQVKEAMQNMRNKVTVIAIAHRITTIINADRILVLENGRVVEEGSPKELLGRPDSYLVKMQQIAKE